MTLVFCIHYFLWYGALTSIFGYESVFARHYTGASAAEYGVLNMLLPFVTVLATPIACSMADRHRSHRSYFTISLIMALISFCLHSMLPLMLADRPRHPAPGGKLLLGPWVFYCMICLLSNISIGINTCLSDSFAILRAEEQGTSFGKIIVWGTYGWALSALIQGLVNQITFLPRLVPGLLTGTILLAIDAIIISLWHRPSDFRFNNDDDQPESCASFKLQLVMLCFILKRRTSLVRFLILFILSGFFMSMHWNYFFLFLEELHGGKFEIISAFSMICQSIVGELPFFILSRKMIDYLGRPHTLSLVFITMGLRFLLYAYFLPRVSAYLVIIADCLQGPNYSLFYVVLTEVGLDFSYCDDETIEMLSKRGDLNKQDKRQVDSVRLLLNSTIQSVAFACYEGIGLGLGSIVGGYILVNCTFEFLWTAMAAAAFSVGILNSIMEFDCSCRVGN